MLDVANRLAGVVTFSDVSMRKLQLFTMHEDQIKKVFSGTEILRDVSDMEDIYGEELLGLREWDSKGLSKDVCSLDSFFGPHPLHIPIPTHKLWIIQPPPRRDDHKTSASNGIDSSDCAVSNLTSVSGTPASRSTSPPLLNSEAIGPLETAS